MIETDKVPIMETWRALEELVDEGVVRSIGVSNFSTQLLYDLLSYARHSVSSLQIEHHPYLVQDTLVTMAQEEGIAITGYSTFGPQSFMELPPSFRARAENVPMLFAGPRKGKFSEYQNGLSLMLMKSGELLSFPSLTTRHACNKISR